MDKDSFSNVSLYLVLQIVQIVKEIQTSSSILWKGMSPTESSTETLFLFLFQNQCPTQNPVNVMNTARKNARVMTVACEWQEETRLNGAVSLRRGVMLNGVVVFSRIDLWVTGIVTARGVVGGNVST